MKDAKAEYHKYKEYYKDRNRRRAAKLRSIMQELKSEPCMDCGRIYPYYVMDFDHVRGEKVRNVSQVQSFSSLEKLMEEVAKCDLVCANCHRERTWRRKRDE